MFSGEKMFNSCLTSLFEVKVLSFKKFVNIGEKKQFYQFEILPIKQHHFFMRFSKCFELDLFNSIDFCVYYCCRQSISLWKWIYIFIFEKEKKDFNTREQFSFSKNMWTNMSSFEIKRRHFTTSWTVDFDKFSLSAISQNVILRFASINIFILPLSDLAAFPKRCFQQNCGNFWEPVLALAFFQYIISMHIKYLFLSWTLVLQFRL